MRFITMFDNWNRRKTMLSALVLLTLLAARFDYTYSMLPYHVQEGDTLQAILDKRVFRNAVIADASVDYIRSTQDEFDVDYVMKNIGREGGYRVEVWFNELSIYGPDNNVVVRSYVLASPQLLNHLLQVSVHNLVVLAIAIWVWVVAREYTFNFSQQWIKEIILPFTWLFVGLPFLGVGLLWALLIVISLVL